MVTSRAVVGSSAISKLGLQESAIAIMTRWRMPPDKACGNVSKRFAGSGIPTSSSISIAWRFAFAAPTRLCRAIVSAICDPTVKTGLRLVIGS